MYKKYPWGIEEFDSFTSKMVFDKTQYPDTVVYTIKELNISLEIPGQVNVIEEGRFYKGGNKIEKIPLLWERGIESKRKEGVVFFAFDLGVGLNFEIYKNEKNFNTRYNFSDFDTVDVNEVIEILNEKYKYKFYATYENKNKLLFLKFRYVKDQIEGITYYTIIENVGIQINFEAAKEDIDIRIIDTIKEPEVSTYSKP
jgi:hypothetical protein